MKKYHLQLMVIYLFLTLGTLSFTQLSAMRVIDIINNQLEITSTVFIELKNVFENGKERGWREFELLLKTEGKKEIFEGEITAPEDKRGKLEIVWIGGQNYTKHIETGTEQEREIDATPKSTFAGSALYYIDFKWLHDTENFTYEWEKRGEVIRAISKNHNITVYQEKKILVEQKEDGLWVVTMVICYGKRGQPVKNITYSDFDKFYDGWRPQHMEVKKSKARYTTKMNLDWARKTVFD